MSDAKEGEDQTNTESSISPVLTGKKLSVVMQNLKEIPVWFGEQYGEKVSELDFGYNALTQVANLDQFKSLNSLVLDNNQLDSNQVFPFMPTLQTLCVNNNNISDLKVFLDSICKAFPNITYLSMLKNPACPNYYFTGKDFDDYRRYRYYVLYRVKKLKFLDSTGVTLEERKQAARAGQYTLPAKPDESQYQRSAPTPDLAEQTIPQLPPELQQEGKGSARFGITSYVYYGKHSEGNRFILNEDL